MKQKIFCILTVFLLPLLFASCNESPKKVESTHDYDQDETAIKAICEKRGAECGDITVKIDDAYDKINCGECNSGFVCDETANKCTNGAETNDTDDITDDDNDNPQNNSEDPIPESSLPQCNSSNKTPCKDVQSGLIWSEKALSPMNHKDAAQFCETLTEGGYSDWRLPDIDELRTLIMNCSGTMPSGSCKVSARTECLSDECFSDQCGCGNDTNGKYSKFGDTDGFWSSSKYGAENTISWGVLFLNAGIRYAQNSYEFYLRCVRGENKTVYDDTPDPEPEPDPCNPNPCLGMEHSNWECYSKGDEYICGCIETSWDGKECVPVNFPECEYPVEELPCQTFHFELIWSDTAPAEATWQEAVLYCQNLEESGLNNWRLPDIDELRTLFNCADNCEVRSENGCLSLEECRTEDDCFCGECLDEFCFHGGNVWESNYSQFDLREILWSSSTNTDDHGSAWFIDFIEGNIYVEQKTETKPFRCVWSNRYTHSCAANYLWNGSTCVPGWKLSECTGIPQHAEGTEYIVQNWNGMSWLPSTKAQYGDNSAECTFKCMENYIWNGSKCVADDFASFPECSSTSDFPCKDSSTYIVWSSKTAGKMEIDAAIPYCESMNEGGYDDWKLPDIDELRTLIINHPKTETGGICRISELKGGCLSCSSDCRNEDCWNTNQYPSGEIPEFSKLGDKETLWSSSYDRDDSENWSTHEYFGVEFGTGSITSMDGTTKYVRCVR
ncbi:DUF1566 domain-containing protein [bacterium]|nr:DUF1566 domain-containing protein [bacterium]